MKKILFIIVCFSLFTSCKKKTSSTDSTSIEYFNCYINGNYWTYKDNPNGWAGQDGLGAGKSGSFYYGISAVDMIGIPSTQILIFFKGNTMPTQDTILLADYNYAQIVDPYKIDSGQSSFSTNSTYTGKLIYSKRESTLLQGTFFFDVFDPQKNNIIHVTNGKFSVIPSN